MWRFVVHKRYLISIAQAQSQSINIPTIGIVICVSMLFACGPKPKAALSKSAHASIFQNPNVLTQLPLDSHSSVQLYLSACKKNTCPIQLRVIRDHHLVASKNLDWGATSAYRYQETWVSAWQGTHDNKLPAYTLGEESHPLTTTIQTFYLTKNNAAILVRQSSGFEHVMRRFALYTVQAQKLQRLWSDKEGQGPWYSDITLFDRPDNTKGLLYLKGLAAPYHEGFDYLEVRRLYQQGDGALINESATGLTALQAGPEYDSAEAARTALAKQAACLSTYWIIKSDQIRGLSEGKAVVIAVAPNEIWAKKEQARVSVCQPDLKVHWTTIDKLRQE
jgi:hypothetical protein